MTSSTAETATQAKGRIKRQLLDFFTEYGSYVVLVILVIVSGLLSPHFLTIINIFLILRQASALGIIALGQTFVILTAGIDLTVGSTLSLSVVLVANLYKYNNSNLLPLFLLVIGFGAFIGVINGFLITRLRIPAIIATLGMMTVIQGLGLMYSRGVPQNTLTDEFRFLGLGKIGVVPVPVLFWAAVIILAVVLLYYTNFGRYIYSVGGNPGASRLSGVKVNRIITMAYMVSGVCAAIAGYVLVARLGVGDNWVGTTYNLDSIAAVAIGGTSLGGGKGGVSTTIAGVLILSVLYNLLLLLGIGYFWQEVVKGIVILGGVILYTSRNRK
jgi:ribose/xylose/arabinose/galactoside ABC-type transport system permease subunit